MKITPVKNNFENDNPKTITFFVDCCCCCCCCLLAPLGTIQAENIISKRKDIKIKGDYMVSNKKKGLINFGFMLLALIIAYVVSVIFDRLFVGDCEFACSLTRVLENNDVLFIAGGGVILYVFFLYLYTAVWVDSNDKGERLRVTVKEAVISLMLAAVWGVISLPLVYGIIMLVLSIF
ncbi:hypothetical protein KKG71_01970 [Patescibacteria group bacterium]|nr:hypothetical protein [Patescibacteria group bacterium]